MSQGYASKGMNQEVAPQRTPWVRPADWLPITLPTLGSEVIYMLCAVYDNNSNYISVLMQGAYTVNWGDGSAPENFATNVQAYKNLSYAGCDPGSLTSDGFRQCIVTITPQAGSQLTVVDICKKHNAAGLPGTTVSPVIDVAMSAPNMTSGPFNYSTGCEMRRMERFRLRGSHASSFLGFGYTAAIKLRTLACPENGSYDLHVGAATGAQGVASLGLFSSCYSLEEAPRLSSTVNFTSTAGMFNECRSMKSVPLFDTSNVTSTSSMFNNCYSLQSVPLFNLSNCTNINSMFYNCFSLPEVPLFDTTKVTSSTYTFYLCASLKAIPALDLRNSTALTCFAQSCSSLRTCGITRTDLCSNFNTAFSGCVSLETVPAMDYSKATTIESAFAACRSLTSVQNINTTVLNTSTLQTFNGCTALTSVTPFDTSGVTTANGMFINCTSLNSIPAPSGNNFKFSACTNFTQMFQGCAISTIPLIDTSAGTNFTSMFQSCTALRTVPALNVAAGTVFTQMFQSCGSLESAPLAGGRYAISYASNSLSAAALDAIYTGLGTAAGSQTITVTTNHGTTGDTPSIATGKGWTVTGS